MSNTIDQYREAKNSYLKLRNQAKKELIARFHELANEMLQLQRELLEDFGEKIAMPAKGKKPRPVKHATPVAKPLVEQPFAPSAIAVSIQKQLEKQSKNLQETNAPPHPTKAPHHPLQHLHDQ